MFAPRSKFHLLNALPLALAVFLSNSLSLQVSAEPQALSSAHSLPTTRVIEGRVESLNDISSLHRVLNRATNDALNGDRTALAHFYQTGLIRDLPEPSTEEIVAVLEKARAQTYELAASGSPRLAAQRLRLVFDLCANLAGISLRADGDETLAWRESFEQFKVPQSLYRPYLVFYTNLLIEGGEASCAISPLKHILEDQPESAEAQKALSLAYKQLHNKRLSYKALLAYQHLRRDRIYTVGTIEGTYDKSVDAPISQHRSFQNSSLDSATSRDLELTDSTSEVWRLGDEAVFDIKDGDLDTASSKLKTVLLIEPGNLGAQANLAVLLNNRAVANSGRFDRNCQDLHTACLLMPTNNISQANLESTLKLIGLDPSSPTMRIRFGDLLLATGDLPGALLEYKEALKLKNSPALQAKVDALIHQLAQGYLSDAATLKVQTNLTCRAAF